MQLIGSEKVKKNLSQWFQWEWLQSEERERKKSCFPAQIWYWLAQKYF